MKNKTYLKASFREIWQSRGRFIAIILIILLGTLLFVGVKTTGPVLNTSGSDYLEKQNLSDLQVISTGGLTEVDESLLKEIPNVEVESGYQFYYADEEKGEVVQVFSYDDAQKQNQLVVEKGYLPKADNELVLDAAAEKLGYQIGDTFTLDDSDQLDKKEYEIVGFVNSPLFISNKDRGMTNVGDGNVDYFAYVPVKNFTSDIFGVLYVTFDNVKGLNTYGSEYKDLMQKNQELVEEKFVDRPKQRLAELRSMIEDEIAPAKKEIADGQTQISEAKEQLTAAQEELDANRQLLAQLPEAQAAAASAQLDEVQKELDENKQTLTEQETKLEDAETEVSDAEKEMADLKMPTYLFNQRTENIGFQDYGDLSDRIAAIANVFPVFFFFIAALITFTTMTRMVEENRKEIGTLKALGYSRVEISQKYVIYAVLAAVIGVALGVVIGTNTIPRIVFELSSDQYNFQKVSVFYEWGPIIQAGVAFLFATLGSVIIVLIKELTEKPSTLLQPKAPKPGKRIFLEYITPLWSRMSFNQKVSYRNLFRYKSRMIMAIIGIAGCTGLMVAGFGIKNSLEAVTDKQFGPIIDYQAVVTLDDGSFDQTEEILEKNSQINSTLPVINEVLELKKAGQATQSVTMTVPKDVKDFSSYLHLSSLDGKSIDLTNDGAVISEKLADLFDIQVGDELTFYDEDQNEVKMKVQEIAQNYLGHFVYITAEYYEKVTGKEYQNNSFLLKTATMTTKEENSLAEQLLATDEVKNTSFLSSQIETQKGMINNLDPVVLIFVVLSGLLAFVVLYNLTNINISERVRELSTIKVLGFFDKEVTMYIIRENIIFTLLGIVVGYGIGYVLTGFIVRQASMESIIFPLVIHWPAYVISAVLTITFTIIVMIVTHFKLKHIDMIDSLKANE
ncbi:FtsX-like permease family protein [Enterococcus sp. BWM-S5]|uniref:FtsX-like permease family protein n=1 Tax=Enterococcus larvae TaxID=2794352 RepID=A0ABS4CHH6_9ENTE|nr:FtsX-like permease family protein [Enterococcus larvae]MBP1046080.1 FtsX-like permease family protein [Enterococcus larvae]